MQLDDAQQVVANHQYGGLLVLAGPGSGKTASITARTARLIRAGADPSLLLSVTFSKKAANEMRDRLAGLTSEVEAERASIHTFHALGDKIMKKSPEACGRQFGYTILDETDQRGLFMRVLKERMNMEKPGKYDYRGWLSAYSRMGQDGISAHDSIHAQPFSDAMYRFAGIERLDQMRWLWHAFQLFEKEKQNQNVVDFNDLLILPKNALARDDRFTQEISIMYPFVTVDEAQDTSAVQYDIIRKISGNHGNLLMVGDDDQSLYGWRGANSSNLRRFIDNRRPKIHKLERNYRSTSLLVKSAAVHIAKNEHRLSKVPYSTRNENGLPGFFSSRDDRQMSQSLVSMLKCKYNSGIPWEKQAVLYRKNRVGEALEPALIEAGIPYEVQGGVKLTERKEVKLALSFARLVCNPRDQMAFVQLAKGIKGLGEKGLDTHIKECREVYEGNLFSETLGIKRKAQIREAIADLAEICHELQKSGPVTLIDCLVDRWGLAQYFPEDKPEQVERREERLRLFEAWIGKALEETAQGDNPWLALQQCLLEDPDTAISLGGKVVLSTIHRAKGLEWAVVHVAGYSDGLMPMRNKDGEIGDPAEERNASYVGMTRAADELYLHHADRLFLGYETLEMAPSPYLDEFEWQLMDHDLSPDACWRRDTQPLEQEPDLPGWMS